MQVEARPSETFRAEVRGASWEIGTWVQSRWGHTSGPGSGFQSSERRDSWREPSETLS